MQSRDPSSLGFGIGYSLSPDNYRFFPKPPSQSLTSGIVSQKIVTDLQLVRIDLIIYTFAVMNK